MVVFAGSPTSIPYSLFELKLPPLTNRLVFTGPFTSTPEPSLLPGPAGSVPLLLATTLLSVTTLALLMVIPSPSLLVALTLVSVTVEALKVAPSLVPLPILLSVNDESLIVIEPVVVVAEKPPLFVPLPSKAPLATVISPALVLRRAVFLPLP